MAQKGNREFNAQFMALNSGIHGLLQLPVSSQGAEAEEKVCITMLAAGTGEEQQVPARTHSSTSTVDAVSLDPVTLPAHGILADARTGGGPLRDIEDSTQKASAQYALSSDIQPTRSPSHLSQPEPTGYTRWRFNPSSQIRTPSGNALTAKARSET